MNIIKFSVLISLFAGLCACYLPVFLMHGLFSSHEEFIPFENWIKQHHPGTQVFRLNIYNHLASVFTSLYQQALGLEQEINRISAENNITSEINLLCFSQGGLVCRAYVESAMNHRVNTFISMSSPQAGQFGTTSFDPVFPNITRETAYKLFYGRKLQRKDPLHYNDYLTRNIFMPLVNGEVDHPLLPVFKQNFVRLSKLVLFGGPDDGVIDPWQSALFSFWETGGAHNLLPMEKQHLYLHDTFGLQTLHKQGKIVQYIVPGIKHLSWKANQTNLVERILPHLN